MLPFNLKKDVCIHGCYFCRKPKFLSYPSSLGGVITRRQGELKCVP